MRAITSRAKQCLALLLAVLIMVPAMCLPAFAAEPETVKTYAEIVADNYDLTEAEKELLKSGYLTSGSITYAAPTDEDGLVTVDTETGTITAAFYQGFVPVGAVITYGENELSVSLQSNGAGACIGTYDVAAVGNAFSVKVDYVFRLLMPNEIQEPLLNAAALLKQGVVNTDAVSGQSGNLYILEQAMPQLVDLANTGVQTSFTTVTLSAECKAAISALNEQMGNNDGKLELSSMVEEYESGAKTGYLMTKGTDMQAEVADLVTKVSTISNALNEIYDNIEWLIEGGYVSETLANQIKTLAGVCNNLATGLAAVNADPWTAANMGTDLVNADADYAKLDTLVAALGELNVVEINNVQFVDKAEVEYRVAMNTVTVNVVLKTSQNNVVKEYASKSVVLTLAKGATPAEILAEVEASGVEAAAKAEWAGVYVEGKFDRTADTLSDDLTEDITYTITYSPKNYTVSIAGDSAEYPYGYQLTLPVHADPAKAYDYYLGGTYYPQGSVVTVKDDMTFTREEGSAYVSGSLLEIIADNYGTAKGSAILTSGALNVDEEINYREPNLESLVSLSGTKLTVAQSYPSSYENLTWEPYSYVVDDNDAQLFNGASQVTIDGVFETVKVYYRLTLTNYTENDVREILDLVETLTEEAEDQKNVMDKLAGYESQMGQLNKNMLNGLNGVIGGYSSANGGGLHSDPATNDELVAYFQSTISGIVANCIEGQNLKLYNIIQAYNDPNNGGLLYYYQNDEAVRNEISVLSAYLNDMLDGGDRQAALEKLMTDNGYGDKADVLETLGSKLAEIEAELQPVNSAIITSDAAKLSALVSALTEVGAVEVTECDSPYIEMGPVTRTAEGRVTIAVKVNAGGKHNTTPISVTVLKGEALNQGQVNSLKEQVIAFVNGSIETEFYNNNYNNGAELDALVGVALEEDGTYEYSWTAKEYTVKIAGEADQIITVNDLTVELPAHPNANMGMYYEYTVDGGTANSGIYTFTKDQLRTLFGDGTYTITRVEKNENTEKLVKMVNAINADMGFEALTLVEKNGVYTGITANISANDMMGLIMGLVMKSGYGYIGLNDEGFIYENDSAELELSIQTLINAMLNDPDFSNDTVIALGENGKGKVVTASMQLGNKADELQYEDLTFTMNLTSVPSQLTEYVDTIKTVSNYIYVESNNGELAVEVTLPEQVYGAYAAALIATGNVDKSDAAKLGQKVAAQFLYDYLTAITGSEMDMVTFTNTLQMLGVDKDLTGYNNIYNKGIAAYNEYVTVAISDAGTAVDISAPGKQTIDGLLNLLGVDASSVATFLPMIKEYKAGGTIDVSADATLENEGVKALIVDAQADGMTNKFEAPSTDAALNAQTSTLAGISAVILLDDVNGDLTVSGTTVLDLNGKNVNGVINATGKLFIIDSSKGTYDAGTVEAVIGSAVILGGKYNTDVSAFLKDGYYMDGKTVRNTLYYITETSTFARAANPTVNFVIDGDALVDTVKAGEIPDVKALAIDIASDLVLNYFYAAKLTVEGEDLIGINVNDLVGIYANRDAAGLAKALYNCVTIGEEGIDNDAGFEAVVNIILADLLDFGAISDALANDSAVATYAVATEPWKIEIEHIASGNYATVNVTSNPDLKKEFNLALTLVSKYNDKMSGLFTELDEIVVDETKVVVDLPAPSYSNQIATVKGGAEALLVVDLTKGGKTTDYATVLGVILAYGNAAKRDAVAAAINAGDMVALKAVVDGTSVKELFNALKAMGKDLTFAQMAKAVGVTANIGISAELDTLYRYVLAGTGKVLEVLDITGMDSKLGGLYNKTTGYYELTNEANKSREGNAYTHSSGYGVDYDLTLYAESGLKLKLFSDVTTWTVTLSGSKGTYYIVDGKEVEPGEVYTLGAGETFVFEYGADAGYTYYYKIKEFKINGVDMLDKFAPGETIELDINDFGAQVELDIVAFKVYVPVIDTKPVCDCGDPNCKCKIECHSALYEDLSAILEETPDIWWHLDGEHYLDYVICKGLMIGVSEEPLLFAPDMLMSRAMIVTALYRQEGKPAVTGNASDYFSDALDGTWYSDAIVWAAQNKIVLGYGNGMVGPNDVLTREQLATLFYRYTAYNGKDVSYPERDLSAGYTDAAEISDWALTGMEWANYCGLIIGPGDGKLVPKGDIRRCEFAALLCRWIWGEYDS